MSDSVKTVDALMEQIVGLLCRSASETASQSAEQVLEVSSEYLSKEAHESLKQFQNLYFGNAKQADAKKNANNAQVDDLIEQIQGQLAAGVESITAISDNLVETEEQSQQRLGLSGFQKQLECLIALEDGLREKLAPVLASLQFDDAVGQRLAHIAFAFSALNKNGANLQVVADQVRDQLSSIEESKSFYEKVLHEQAPEGIEESILLFDLSA